MIQLFRGMALRRADLCVGRTLMTDATETDQGPALRDVADSDVQTT